MGRAQFDGGTMAREEVNELAQPLASGGKHPAVIWFRADGAIASAQAASSGTTLLVADFGSCTAMLVGAMASIVMSLAAAPALKGNGAAPSLATVLAFGGWMILAPTTIVIVTRVRAAFVAGSTALTLTALLGWETVASTLLYCAVFLGASRARKHDA